MKHLSLALVCLVALTSCKSTGPVYDECMVSLLVDQDGRVQDVVADCIRPDKTFYERRGMEIDGMYAYSADHRANIIRWAKAKCSGRPGN